MKTTIQNPILRGFHPDPSIIRVGEDYYIATSTFEWWPGVRLHHSRDLKNWEQIEYPLSRLSQLDLRGVGASQGIWAPCLTYDQGTFYLVYTVVRSFYCNMYDTENYLVTSDNIHGPWSEPVALNNFGFDPSLFHDEDGRKYMVSMVTDHRVPKKYAGRLVLQEYDPEKKAMTGPVRDIYRGEKIFLEGPHIYKRQGWYYLFAADTGTGEGHGQSVLRSRDIWGPYEMLKENHGEQREENEAFSILTSRHYEDILLQKSGHGDLVETPGGEWYMVHLCGRAFVDRNPADAGRFPNSRRYMMGRETAIQKILWREDGWPVLEAGGTTPQNEVPVPKEVSEEVLCRKAAAFPLVRDDFEEKVLSLDYQSLRIPMDEHYLSLSARPGWLRMYGRSGLSSRFSQTLIARRMREYCMEASACVEFEPEVFKQMAGLIFLYDCDNYLYLHISRDEDVGKCITLLKAENKKYEYLTDYIPVREKEALYLKMETRNAMTRFYYGYSEKDWQEIGPLINASFLSDEACGEGWFTGAMIGICCQDMTGFGRYADFDWFEVKCEPEESNR
ncbi:MAG: glycoside hydrolase family 43 protein [Lachnospiraceae bacterium]|nr:glycoside hydrolase family 43 protein [Lachnospiraceae bacterium]